MTEKTFRVNVIATRRRLLEGLLWERFYLAWEVPKEERRLMNHAKKIILNGRSSLCGNRSESSASIECRIPAEFFFAW